MKIYDTPIMLDFVIGDSTGLAIPAHAGAIRTAGEAFLTDALRAFGSLSTANRVSRITGFEQFNGGSTGQKLLLTVEYADAEPHLSTNLFVKFSRDFTDGFRDRRRNELEAEIRLAKLSRMPGFPIAVPAAYYADFHAASGTGLIITERIDFGRGGIEKLHPKCMDHELAAPLDYYRSIVTALAHLAAAHKSGALSPQVDMLFPFDAVSAAADDPIGLNEQQVRKLVFDYKEFARRCPQLLPANISSPRFIARLEHDAVRFLQHETAVKQYMQADSDFIALSHFNANIDNAWFWRDCNGVLQCGLLDWQRARQMNVAYALWGGLCGASLDIWNRHLDDLLDLFTCELHSLGGPRLDVAELRLHLGLYAATMVLAGLFDAPARVLACLPEAADASGPLDPVFRRSEAARSFLHVFTVFLNLWEMHDLGASVDIVLARTGEAALAQNPEAA
jgi:hypothetical protein